MQDEDTQRSRAASFLLAPSLTLAALWAARLLYRPVTIPRVDDWLLLPWGTHQTDNVPWWEYWSALNGHQHVLMKLYTAALGRFTDLDLVASSLAAVALAAATAPLLLSRLPGRASWSFFAFSSGCALLTLNARQLQNLFLLICFPWMMALFTLALFVALDVPGPTSPRRRLITLGLLLAAPLTNGLGLSLCFGRAVAAALAARTGAPGALATICVAVTGGLLALALPRLLEGGHGLASPGASLAFVVTSPGAAVAMYLATIGQPFVPLPPSATWLTAAAVVIGLVGTLAATAVLVAARRAGRLTDCLLENPLIVCGLVFPLSLVLGRGGREGASLALEGRYTTGSVLLWLGLLCYSWRALPAPRRWIAGAATLALGAQCNLTSLGGALEYHTSAHARSVEVTACFEAAGWRHSARGDDLLWPGEWMDRARFDATNRALRDERKTFYTAAPPSGE